MIRTSPMVERPVEKSELQILLEKNTSVDGELTDEERLRAIDLICDPEYTKGKCWVCLDITRRAIYDTGMCADHAFYALTTGK